jgi:Uma2 family endonuclease
MNGAQKILPHYTYNDWIHWEGRWELINGFPIAMSPMPMPKHQRIASAIKTELTLALRKAKCKKCSVYDPLDYKVADDTILVPDALVVCGKITKAYLDFPPALVVEVLSPSTVLRDRNTKHSFYRKQGVKYYLIIDSDKKIIEIYKLKNKKYELQLYTENFSFYIEEGCTITPDFSLIWE